MGILRVAFTYPKNFSLKSWLIAKTDGDRGISHALMVYLPKDMVTHAVGEGVCWQPAASVFAKKKIVKYFDLVMTDEQEKKFIAYCDGSSGKEYSQSQLLLIALGHYMGMKLTKGNGTEKYICSEYMADVLEYVFGLEFFGIHDYITPVNGLEQLEGMASRGELPLAR